MEIDYATIGLIIGLVSTTTTILGKLADKWIGNFWGFMNKQTDKGGVDSKQETEIALMKKDIATLQCNHLVHEKAISDRLEKFERAFIKIAVKLQIENPFGN